MSSAIARPRQLTLGLASALIWRRPRMPLASRGPGRQQQAASNRGAAAAEMKAAPAKMAGAVKKAAPAKKLKLKASK